MVLKYVISASSNPNDFVAKVWEAESDGPGGEVYTSPAIPAPHSAPYVLTVTGLDRVTHILRLYDAVTDELIHEYTAEAKVDLVTIFDPIRFKIGDAGPNTPLSGTSVYSNSDLVGLEANEYIIHRNNYGELFPDIHYEIGLDGDGVPDGSWTLLQVGDVFNDGEEFTIKRQPNTLETAVNDSVVGKGFGGFIDISANTSYTAAHLRKLIRFTGAYQYTFEAADTLPIGYTHVFTRFGPGAGNGIVNFLNGPLKWGDTTVTSFTVERYCTASFTWDGTNWNVYTISISSAPADTEPILGSGKYIIGDLPPNDPVYTVVHGLGIVGDYNVFLSVKTTEGGNRINNNLICASWIHSTTDKPNTFILTPQEIDHVTNSLTICWLIVKG